MSDYVAVRFNLTTRKFGFVSLIYAWNILCLPHCLSLGHGMGPYEVYSVCLCNRMVFTKPTI